MVRSPACGLGRQRFVFPAGVKVGLNLEDAFRVTDRYVTYYKTVRLHAALGYVTPAADRLAGRHVGIWKERDRRLSAARERRRVARSKMLSPAEGCAVVEPLETQA